MCIISTYWAGLCASVVSGVQEFEELKKGAAKACFCCCFNSVPALFDFDCFPKSDGVHLSLCGSVMD